MALPEVNEQIERRRVHVGEISSESIASMPATLLGQNVDFLALMNARRIYWHLVADDFNSLVTEDNLIEADEGEWGGLTFQFAASENTAALSDWNDFTPADPFEGGEQNYPNDPASEDQNMDIDQLKYGRVLLRSPDENEIINAERGIGTERLYQDLALEAITDLAEIMARYTDTFLAGVMDAAVPGGNKIGSTVTPKVPTKADAFEYVADLRALLDDDKAPQEDRSVVCPPWFYAMMAKDVRYTAAQFEAPYSGAIWRPGQVGWSNGFAVFVSTGVPNTTGEKYKILGFQKRAVQKAELVYRLEETGAPSAVSAANTQTSTNGVQAAHVYGAKVQFPAHTAVLIANPE